LRHFVLGFAIDFYNGYYSLSRKKPLVLFQLESEMCTTNESNILFQAAAPPQAENAEGAKLPHG